MNKRIVKIALIIPAALIILSLTACESLQFYSQAVVGHSKIMLQREPIQQLIATPETDETLRRKLKIIQRARLFAIDTLKLPDNGSYTQYADIKRPYPVWNVVATEAYSTRPIQHCFPVAGCVSYRGFFNKDQASAYAKKLRDKGLDTTISGASAYSTLGWFEDPVLNTMLNRSDLGLAGLVFHELAHQAVYQAGDTSFNESFATAVELGGVKAWIAQQASSDQNQQAIEQYFTLKNRNADVIKLILKHHTLLQNAYQASSNNQAALATIKQQGFAALRADYKKLRAQGGGSEGYDRWFASTLNNASLVLFGDYHGWLDAFNRLLVESGNDWAVFYKRVKALTKLDKKQRHQQLKALNHSLKN